LHRNLELHWNNTVTQLTTHILQQFMDMDEKLFKQVEMQFKERHKPLEVERRREERWKEVQRQSMLSKIHSDTLTNGNDSGSSSGSNSNSNRMDVDENSHDSNNRMGAHNTYVQGRGNGKSGYNVQNTPYI